MSKKKKAKPAARKVASKPVKKKVAKAAARKPAARVSSLAASETKRTAQSTIFIFKTDSGIGVRSSPQYLTGGPGYIEWTIVNMTGGELVPAVITWPEGGPWGKDPIEIRGHLRRSLSDAAPGHYKYTVTVGDVFEDPEVEIPEN
jgi:hypothetical protein